MREQIGITAYPRDMLAVAAGSWLVHTAPRFAAHAPNTHGVSHGSSLARVSSVGAAVQ